MVNTPQAAHDYAHRFYDEWPGFVGSYIRQERPSALTHELFRDLARELKYELAARVGWPILTDDEKHQADVLHDSRVTYSTAHALPPALHDCTVASLYTQPPRTVKQG